MSFKVQNLEVSQATVVTFESHKIVVNYNNGEIQFELELSQEIVPEESSQVASARKLEIKLKKK